MLDTKLVILRCSLVLAAVVLCFLSVTNRTIFLCFQEVTLERTNTEEKVGLTLCYGSAEDDITDIFISEVRKIIPHAKNSPHKSHVRTLQVPHA